MRRFKALCWHTPKAPRRSQHALSWVGGRACREGQAAVTCSEARRWHEPPQRLGMQLRRGRARSVASAPTLVAPSDLLPAPSFGDGRSFRGDRACVTCPLRPSLLRQSQSLVPRAASGPMTARRRGGVIALNLPVARHVAGRQLAPYGAPKRGMRGRVREGLELAKFPHVRLAPAHWPALAHVNGGAPPGKTPGTRDSARRASAAAMGSAPRKAPQRRPPRSPFPGPPGPAAPKDVPARRGQHQCLPGAHFGA
jgi:hypothetical protein